NLVRAMQGLCGKGYGIEVFEALGSLPFFDPDLDQERPETLPDVVRGLRAAVQRADAVIIATPEYAHGIPGVLKNGLDWLVGGPEMIGKPTAAICASASDGAFALRALVEVLRTMSARVPDACILSIPGIRAKVGPGGVLRDAALAETLRVLLDRLAGGK